MNPPWDVPVTGMKPVKSQAVHGMITHASCLTQTCLFFRSELKQELGREL